jgi:hypothetical protein
LIFLFIKNYLKISFREFKDNVNWNSIFLNIKNYQKILFEFKDKVAFIFLNIKNYLKISLKNFNLEIPKNQNNWLYIPKEEKLNIIKKSNLYEIIDDTYIIAYKSTRSGYSVFNWQYYYEVGKTYESHCDCNLNKENSFGLSAWTKEQALELLQSSKC